MLFNFYDLNSRISRKVQIFTTRQSAIQNSFIVMIFELTYKFKIF